MTIAAGIDIGNSTTEVLLARVGRGEVDVLADATAPTRRSKGSAESLDGAVSLLRRLERRSGLSVEVAVAAPLRPVDTAATTLPEPEQTTGRLRLVASGSRTVGGEGSGIGRPVLVNGHALSVDGSDAVVAVVPRGVAYQAVLEPLRALASGGRLMAVVMAEDEAVLLGNRLAGRVPVIDEVPTDQMLDAVRVAAEVRPAGTPLRDLADPLQLVAQLGLRETDRADAARLSSRLRDASNAVIALSEVMPAAEVSPAAWFEIDSADGRRCLLLASENDALRDAPVGAAHAYGLPPAVSRRKVDDLFAVDLGVVADTVVARSGAQRSRAVALSMLHADSPYRDPGDALADRLGVAVQTVASEATAARAGGISTPGAEQTALVVDIGGGTIDVVAAGENVVAAGGGQLLTISVAALTGATPAAAEWVKRGPAVRVETPHLLLGEDGSREFLDRPAGRETVGSLAVRGPAGLLPFDRTHAPGEWRALRLRLKADALGANVARAVRTLNERPTTVVLVGGPVGDDEVLASVARALPSGVAVGRGNAAGMLGHRYGVAYGLLLSLLRS